MKLKNLKILRLIISGLTAFAATGMVARAYFLHFWKFDLFLTKHWNLIWRKWNAGWIVSKNTEYVFLISLLALPLIAAAVWFLFYRTRWQKLLKMPLEPLQKRKKKELEKKSLEAARGDPEKLKKAPAPKHTARKLPEKLVRLRGMQSTLKQRADSASAAAGGNARLTDTVLTGPQIWDNLVQTLESSGVFVLREMTLTACRVNLLAVTQDGLFMLCSGPEDGNTWTVDENRHVWTTEQGTVLPSPLQMLIKGRDELKNLISADSPAYKNIAINCCLLLDHGKITNVDNMLNYLTTVDLSVLRTGSCNMSELPDTDALIEYIRSMPKADRALNDAVAVAVLSLMNTEQT